MQSTKPRVAVLEVAAARVEGVAMAAEVELLAEAGAAGGAAAQMPEVAVAQVGVASAAAVGAVAAWVGERGGARAWSLPPPPPSLTPPPPPRVAGAKRRATAAESRWQSGAREQFDAAVRKKRRDSDG